MSRRGIAALVSALVTVAALTVVLVGARGVGADDGGTGLLLLQRAETAAARLRFDGTVVVEWRDRDGVHRRSVPVHMDDGVLHMGDDRLVSAGARRLLRTDAGWQLLWAGGHKGTEPDATRKYRFSVIGPASVAGRKVNEVTVTRAGETRPTERLYFDEDTGMLLRRDQLDARGTLVHRFAFVRMTTPVPASAPKSGDVPTPNASSHRARAARADHVPDDLAAPAQSATGSCSPASTRSPTDRCSCTTATGCSGSRSSSAPGELDWDALPDGRSDGTARRRPARVYSTAAGSAVVWGSDDVTYTCVTDAPLDEVAAVTATLTPTSSSALEDIGQFVTAPFSWG